MKFILKPIIFFLLGTLFVFPFCSDPTSETFKIIEYGTVVDRDYNKYKTVKYGNNQWWMIENLRVTQYNNGENIPIIGNDWAEWANMDSGAYCQGKWDPLYNWYVVDNAQKLAPVGWHVPTLEEWNQLINYLGEDAEEELTSDHRWRNGIRYSNGNQTSGNYHGGWWTATEDSSSFAWFVKLGGGISLIGDPPPIGPIRIYAWDKKCGFSVRCVKD